MSNYTVNININADTILHYNKLRSTKKRCITKGVLTSNSNTTRKKYRDEVVLKCNRDMSILNKELVAIKRLCSRSNDDTENSFVITLRCANIITLNTDTITDSSNNDDIWYALILDKGSIDVHLLGTLISQKHDSIQQYNISIFQWKLRVAMKLLDIIIHIHTNGLCWYDIKPSNFVLFLPDDINLTGKRKEINSSKLYNYLNEKCYIRAIDLGGAQENGAVIDINTIQVTTKFSCPEIAYLLYNKLHKEVVVDQSADLWSVGMMLFQLFRFDFQPMLQLSNHTYACDVLKYLALETNSLETEIKLNTSVQTYIFDDNRNVKDTDKIEILEIIRSLLNIDKTKRSQLEEVKQRISTLSNKTENVDKI